jgi:hypothetical protein
MNMAPEYWNDWIGSTAAAKLIGVSQPYIYTARQKHRIGTQVIAGRTLYYKPDCERARDAIAKGRAERQAKTTDAAIAK